MRISRSAVHARRWSIGAAAVAVLAVAGCSTGSSSGGATASGASGASYFKGKTITMIVPSKPGGSFDSWGRLLAQYMGKHLHATIKVTNVPAGNTAVGQNELAAAPANGLTIGWLNIPNDVELAATKANTLNFDPADLAIIGGIPSGLSGIFVQASTPYKTIADLQHATRQLTALTVTSGNNDLVLRTILGVYGVKAHYVSGYDNTADLAAGFIRGDGQVTSENSNALVDPIKDGKVRGIVMMAASTSHSEVAQKLKSVLTLAQLISQDPPGSAGGKLALTTLLETVGDGQVIAAPKGTPAGYVSALEAAMKWSMAQPGLIEAAGKQSLVPGFASASHVQSQISVAFSHASALAPYLNSK